MNLPLEVEAMVEEVMHVLLLVVRRLWVRGHDVVDVRRRFLALISRFLMDSTSQAPQGGDD